MKVLSAECYGAGADVFELEVLKHIQSTASGHEGRKYITTLEDSFEHVGPYGTHVCLIFEVMAESLLSFPDWFGGVIPNPLVQRFTTQLLKAIDCAHECGVIHTGTLSWPSSQYISDIIVDIKQSNIMVQIPDESIIQTFLEKTKVEEAPPGSRNSEYKIIKSQSLRDYYFEDGFNMMSLTIALADWGVASWTHSHLTEHIQPVLLRAPEVLLQAPWGPEVDIWNLGALVPELIYGQCMFNGADSGEYELESHLEEMNALLGPFSRELINRSGLLEAKEWFDDDGNVRDSRLSKVVPLEVRFSDLPESEAGKFLQFVTAMLDLDPSQRKSAKELLTFEWIEHDFDDEEGNEGKS